jgi:hypothetical protein
MWWPAGHNVVPNGSLRQLLARSGRWHARTAVTKYGSEDLDDLLEAAVSTGSALELMTKAFLASITPSLLADGNHRDSVLMLAGKGTHGGDDALKLRSLQAQTALTIAKHFSPPLPIHDLKDPVALRVRNAATHMALVDVVQLRQGVVQMATLVEALLIELELDHDLFWGDAADSVTVVIDEAKSELDLRVHAKRVAAQQRLAQLMIGFAPDTANPVLAVLSGRAVEEGEHNEAQTCPVCGQQGWLICSVERGPVEYDYDEDGDQNHVWVSRTGYPYAFECPVCQLKLQDVELSEFDFPSEIVLDDDEDPIEHWEYEPDPDDFD